MPAEQPCPWCCRLAKINGAPLCHLCDDDHQSGMHKMRSALAENSAEKSKFRQKNPIDSQRKRV